MKPLEDASTLLKSVLALAALAPGVSLLAGLVQLPPQTARLTAMCVTVLGPVLVLISLLLRNTIRRLPVIAAIAAALLLTVAGFLIVSHYGHRGLTRIHEVTLPDASCAGTKNLLVFEPSAPAQRLQEAIRDSGDFLAALTENCVDVLPWAQQDSWRDEQYMLWLLLAAHACFTAAFLLLLWKAAALLREPKDPATPARLLE